MTQTQSKLVENIPLRIYLLSDFRIENDSDAVELRHGKARALFAYLLLHSKVRHLREHLADLLWPESAADRAGRNLSDALYRLRQVIGDQWLIVERDAITLLPDAALWVDVWAFEAVAQNVVPTDDALAAALNISRCTILRDMQALAAAGSMWQTRERG